MTAHAAVEPARCLVATPIVDADHPEVVAYADRHGTGAGPVAIAVALYYAVRDGIRYDPYSIELTPRGMSASQTLAGGRGWCVSKAVLLAACCRARGIPAALGFADVRNHLSTERMRRTMRTDVFYWHGYTALWLEDRWVKATPAFNVELCERFRIRPLEFNGREDSIYHPFDMDGRQHMEYLAYRGEYADLPLAAMADDFRRQYPALMDALEDGDFDDEVRREAPGAGQRA
jgi:transglutaminase-like putative cysteine protease